LTIVILIIFSIIFSNFFELRLPQLEIFGPIIQIFPELRLPQVV